MAALQRSVVLARPVFLRLVADQPERIVGIAQQGPSDDHSINARQVWKGRVRSVDASLPHQGVELGCRPVRRWRRQLMLDFLYLPSLRKAARPVSVMDRFERNTTVAPVGQRRRSNSTA